MSWTGKKSNVTFIKPESPAFLKKFKQQVGYKEDGGLSAKFEKLPKATDEDLQDGDDELPQVVQLDEGDISQDDFDKIKEVTRDNDVQSALEPGKIVFKRKEDRLTEKNDLKTSTKRKIEEKSYEKIDENDQTEKDTNKKSKTEKDTNQKRKTEKDTNQKSKTEKHKSKSKKYEASNKKLLSFAEDEDDDET